MQEKGGCRCCCWYSECCCVGFLGGFWVFWWCLIGSVQSDLKLWISCNYSYGGRLSIIISLGLVCKWKRAMNHVGAYGGCYWAWYFDCGRAF